MNFGQADKALGQYSTTHTLTHTPRSRQPRSKALCFALWVPQPVTVKCRGLCGNSCRVSELVSDLADQIVEVDVKPGRSFTAPCSWWVVHRDREVNIQ